ncbi:MAG: hypothetical protein AAB214_10005 [Fibrobacterota bacterium]
MRETAERHVELRSGWSSQQTIDLLEREAERMYEQGWRYTGSHVDALLENVVLCFEREIEHLDDHPAQRRRVA